MSPMLKLAAAFMAAALFAVPAALAAGPQSFTAGGATVRFATPDGICFLDPDEPRAAALLDEVQQRLTESVVFAAVAVCSSLARGGAGGLTALFAFDKERALPPEMLAAQFAADGIKMRAQGTPFFDDRAAFIAGVPPLTWDHVGDATIAAYEDGRIRAEVGATEMPDGLHLVLTSATAMKEMTLRVVTFANLRSDAQLDLALRLHEALLGSVRDLMPR